MLDNTGILVSSLMMFFIIIQAVRLDATRPWFEKPGKKPAADEASARGARTGLAGAIVPWRQRRR